MSGSSIQEIINLDDDDQQAPAAPKAAVGINYSLFPKLYSMLNKKKPKQQEKIAEHIIPVIIKSDNNVNEVCTVVPILMPQKKVSESQLNNSANQGNGLFEMVQREMLLVEECFETLVPVQAPKSTAIPNETIQPHIQPIIKQPDNEMVFLQPIEQVVVCQASIEGPEVVNLQDQQIRQEKIIQISCEDQGPIVLPPPQNVIQYAEHPVQPNKQMELQVAVEQKAINQVQKINISQKPLQNEDISLTKGLSIPQITKILMNLLPDMSNAIQAMNDIEILDIYKNVQAELPEGQLQKFIKQLYPDLCVNFDLTQNKEASSSQIVRQIELQDACEINPAWSDIEVMSYFKSLPFQKLRLSMKKYFHYEDDHFNQMNYDDLLDILNQAIAEMQKKSESIQQKPQQKIQSQPQQVAEPTQNQFCHQNQEQNPPPSQQNAIIEAQKIKILQMKKFLLDNIQNLTPQILQTIKEDYIKMLYDDAVNGRLSRIQIAQKIDSYSNSIMEKCIQKFPHLQMQINKVSKSQMDDLMSQFINKNRKNNQNDTIQIVDQIRQQPPQKQQINFSSEHQQNRQQAHQQQENYIPNKQKRSYDAMMNQSIRNNQNIKHNSKHLKIKDLRERLIQRLPDLKDNIMALDDSEIQKVYNDSIQKNRQNYTVKRNKDSQSKPVILMKDRKPQIINKPQCSKSRTECQFQNANVYQINNVQKKKKTKTIVLIHTEEQSDEEMGESSKYKKTDQGIQKKSSCECWQKATLGQLIKKLTEILQKKN